MGYNTTMIKDKAFYRNVIKLVIPLVLNNILSFCVQMLDSVMVGYLGDLAVSAVSLAGQPFFIFTILVYGLGSGGAMLISQFWGKKDLEKIRQIMGMMFVTMTIIALLYTAACIFIPEYIMRIYSSDTAVIAESVRYLRVVAFSYIFNALVSCYISALQAKEDVKISTCIYAMSFTVNFILNYGLIFGRLGFPKMGIVGAALGTVGARLFEFIAILIYNRVGEKELHFTLKYLRISDRPLFSHFLKQSLPVIGDDLCWSLGSSARVAIIGHISTEFVTAASIAGVAEQFGLILMYGTARSAAFIMGKAVGAGQIDYARRIGKAFMVLSIIVGVIGCGLVLGTRDLLLLMYPNITPASRLLARQLITAVGVVMLLTGMENTSLIGVLRGAGDNHFALAVDAGGMWLASLPLGLLAAFVLKLPAWQVYACMRVDSIIKPLVCLPRIWKGNYIKDVTVIKSSQ